ncbi:hypothetical protein NIES2111_03790 [Nostoc sp. NIES-2111]|nr:hypothetical protein NIES2111_03790 [Nostoc sp. NIES-2111]
MGFLKKLVNGAANRVKKVATTTVNFIKKIPKPLLVLACICLIVFVVAQNPPYGSDLAKTLLDPTSPSGAWYWLS